MKAMTWSALILALMALPLSAQAGPGQSPRAERISQALHLTDTQQASIQSIRAKHRPDLALRRDAAHRAQTALQAALRDAATPEVQLRALYDKAAGARFEMMLARRSVRQEVQAVLTPEQRATAAELRDRAQARMRERMHHLRMAAGMAG
jgi:Spy/CpxP family protein refolding chaperone